MTRRDAAQRSLRLFAAVEVPDHVRDWLRDRVAGWRDRLPGWRWSDPATWHVTLAFFGSVHAALVPDLSVRLARAAGRADAFDVRLAGLGAFSRPARAGVLWVGVEQPGSARDTRGAPAKRRSAARPDRTPLAALADSVTAAGRRVGIAVEEQRRYHPHVTLGRRRDPVDLRQALAGFAGEDTRSAAWQVRDFVLVESHLGAAVRHEVVGRFPLRG